MRENDPVLSLPPREQWCRHFTGFINLKCARALFYLDLRSGQHPDYHWPCLGEETSNPCVLFAPRTAKEEAQHAD